MALLGWLVCAAVALGVWGGLYRRLSAALLLLCLSGSASSDDTNELRRLLASGPVVTIPPGDYTVSASLPLKSGTTVSGHGATIRGNGSAEVLLLASGVSDVTVTGLTIDGGCTVGVYLDRCERVWLRDVRITGCVRPRSGLNTCAVLLNQARDCDVTDSSFAGNGHDPGPAGPLTGTILFRPSVVDSTGCRIRGCRIRNAGTVAVGGFDFSGCEIEDNRIDQGAIGTASNADGYGVLLYDSRHAYADRSPVRGNSVRENTITDCHGTGVYVVHGEGTDIADNRLRRVALGQDGPSLIQGGIVANECVGTTIRRNVVSGVGSDAHRNVTAGIAVAAGTGDTLLDNVILGVRGRKSDGVWIGGTGMRVKVTTDPVLLDNVIRGFGRFAIHPAGPLRGLVDRGNVVGGQGEGQR